MGRWFLPLAHFYCNLVLHYTTFFFRFSTLNYCPNFGGKGNEKMYFSGENEIMFGPPRNAKELPAVRHFMPDYKK
ncbi:hypothetical protein SGRA_4090 [Saprospira grandis str. Lewin]|uniref:Uncharacterized protein n=1 Tax=Saprospira grandis (strain Lewin) TaxID=984262 RepID=H6L7D3_SAPGL|nr:hypothetical protein SGRA_4090 [Saprospira grandis str. Lewin]